MNAAHKKTTQKTLPTMCRQYNQRERCARLNCQELHLCFHFLLNRCTDQGCTKVHDLETPRNVLLLERLGWCGPGDMQLALDSLRRRVRGQAISVCLAYNAGCCKLAGCYRLHVCHRHVLDGCPLDDCALSHNVVGNQHNDALLAAAGLADTPVSELLRRLKEQLRRRPPQPAICRAVYGRPGGCERHCLRLHCCEPFTRGQCRYGDKCFKSHSLRDPHNQRVLRFFGWTESRALAALAAEDGRPASLPTNTEPRAEGGDGDDDGDGADLSAERSQDQHDEESGAGAETCVKKSEDGGSQRNRTERAAEIAIKYPERYHQVSAQRAQQRQQQQQTQSDAVERLERERREWQQKEKEWEEKEQKQTERQAREQEERERQERARQEEEDQARAQKEREQQDNKREREKHKKDMTEKESRENKLLEKYARLIKKYTSSEKTMTTIKQMNTDFEKQIASLQMESQARGQEEKERQERTRQEGEDQARAQMEREKQEKEREREKHKKEMTEKESREKELLETYVRLMDKYTSSEKTMTTLKQMNAELEQQMASLQMLLQEFERGDQPNVLKLKEHEERQKKNLEELAKLREQARKQKECLECSVCLGIFAQPVTLGCSHTFCKACIENVRRSPQINGPCPLCRKVTTMQVPCLALENIAKYMPDVQEQPDMGGATGGGGL